VVKKYLASCVLLALVAGSAVWGQSTGDGLSSFFMGRVKYSKNDGNDCRGVGRNLAKLVSQVSTVPIADEKRVAFTDLVLFETPFLFMNGHRSFALNGTELENLRVYLEHGGFLFASGCCTNPAFPEAWRREMRRAFPSAQIRRIDYSHPIYRVFYRIDRVRSLHRNTDVFLEGVFLDNRLVSVMCEDGLCCAFSANNSCNVGRGISPQVGKKLALNLAVYAMTH